MRKEVKPVRNHKDRLFRVLFREKKELLSLYNAVNGTNYQDAEAMIVGIFECDEEKVMKMICEDGREEGRAEGMMWGRIAGKAEAVLDLLEEIGDVPEELRSRIQKEQDVLKLKKWLKLAFEERTIEAFMEKM